MAKLQIVYKPVDALSPYASNPRTHSKAQIRQIARSIENFGFSNPILIDGNNGIIAGHGRVEAAKLLGITDLPTVELSSLSEAQKKAYIIADNCLAELAGWDDELLCLELQGLIELDFEMELTGFDTPQLDILLTDSAASSDAADAFEAPSFASPPVSRLGDRWLLGKHVLLCGDATQPECYATLMGEDKAQLVFTDPPYNVPIKGHVSGKGKTQHNEFAMASGEMSEEDFTAFLSQATTLLCEHSTNGAIHFICMDWRHCYELLNATRQVYSELKNICIWNKDNGGMGSLYRSKHEMVFVFKHGKKAHINNVDLGRHGRNRFNVWDYPGANSWQTDQAESLALHPTVKPIRLVEDAIKDCSKRNGIVLDPFAGAGTTLLAAERTQRRARVMELEPHYVDTIIRRYYQLTGEWAQLAEGGQAFPVIDVQRNQPDQEVA